MKTNKDFLLVANYSTLIVYAIGLMLMMHFEVGDYDLLFIGLYISMAFNVFLYLRKELNDRGEDANWFE